MGLNSIAVQVAHSRFGNSNKNLGGSPGLAVMGRDLRSEGRGFESRTLYCMDIFSHVFVVKIVMMLFEKTENKQK